MKFLIQKVSSAEVSVEKNIVGKIQDGLCVFVGYKNDDTNEDINYLVKKLVNMTNSFVVYIQNNSEMSLRG